MAAGAIGPLILLFFALSAALFGSSSSFYFGINFCGRFTQLLVQRSNFLFSFGFHFPVPKNSLSRRR